MGFLTKYLPDRKVWAGGFSAVIASFLMIAAARYGVVLSLEQAISIVMAVWGLVSYMVPPAQRDILKRMNDELVRIAQDDPKIPVTKPPVTPKR